MNNSTIFRCDLTIKLRGDHVYDLYINGKWVASRGSYENILKEMCDATRDVLLNEESDLKVGTKVKILGKQRIGTIYDISDAWGYLQYIVVFDKHSNGIACRRKDLEVIE